MPYEIFTGRSGDIDWELEVQPESDAGGRRLLRSEEHLFFGGSYSTGTLWGFGAIALGYLDEDRRHLFAHGVVDAKAQSTAIARDKEILAVGVLLRPSEHPSIKFFVVEVPESADSLVLEAPFGGAFRSIERQVHSFRLPSTS